MPQAIRGYFGDGESLGLAIDYSVEEQPLGTAGSVRLASAQLDDTFLVISGDALCDVDSGALVAAHRERKAPRSRSGSSRSRTRSSSGSSSPTRTAVSSGSSRSRRWGQVFSDTINTGIYVLEPEALRHVPTGRPYDFSKELFPLLLEMGRPIYGHVLEGYWQDIGNLEQFRQANFDALDERVRAGGPGHPAARERLDRRRRRSRRRRARRRPRVRRQRTAGSRATRPSGRTPCSRTASRCASTPASRARSIDVGTHVGRSAVVEGAIIGRQCDLRDHVRVHEGVAIGDQVTVGAEASIFPGVRIYPFKEVETGAQIYESVIWESRRARGCSERTGSRASSTST